MSNGAACICCALRHIFNDRSDVIILELANVVEYLSAHIELLLVGLVAGLIVAGAQPVDGNACEVTLTTYHLATLHKLLTHELLQGHTTFVHGINKVALLDTTLAEVGLQCVDRHVVRTLGKGSGHERCACGLGDNGLHEQASVTTTANSVALVHDDDITLCKSLESVSSELACYGSCSTFLLVFLVNLTILSYLEVLCSVLEL